MNMRSIPAFAVGFVLGSFGSAFAADTTKALEAKIDELKPGLGEIMAVIQQHHAKLYLAGSAANWPLAEYQADEIKEGLEDVVKYHTHWKDIETPLNKLTATFVDKKLEAVEASIKTKNKGAFVKAFDELTAGCNGCHSAANHGFIVIQTPTGNEFTNQKFAP